jgi:hypothetical protein
MSLLLRRYASPRNDTDRVSLRDVGEAGTFIAANDDSCYIHDPEYISIIYSGS